MLLEVLNSPVNCPVILFNSSHLHIVFEELALAHYQQVGLSVCWAQSFLTEGQEGCGAREVDQSRHSVCHAIRLFPEQDGACWKIHLGSPHF